MSRVSVNAILQEIRILIAKECEKISKMSGEIEVDESYFGAKRMHGKRGRGAGCKSFYFVLHTRNCKQKGLLKRNCCVYTQLVKHCSAKELLPIIKDFAELNECEIYSDS